MVAFDPGQFRDIYEDFNRNVLANLNSPTKRYASDERFISYAARDRLRVHSRRIAVKFHWEFMLPYSFLESMRRRLPWVARRRKELVAITFEGKPLKPWRIAACKTGDLIGYKRLKASWAYPAYSDYWRRELE